MMKVEVGDIVLTESSSGFFRVLGFVASPTGETPMVKVKRVLTSTGKPVVKEETYEVSQDSIFDVVDDDWLEWLNGVFNDYMNNIVKAMEGDL